MISDDVAAAVFDSLPTPVAVLGPDGTVLRLSEAWRRSAATGVVLLPVRPGMSWLAACDQAADESDQAAGQHGGPTRVAVASTTAHSGASGPVTPARSLALLSRQMIDRRRTRARVEMPQAAGARRWLDVRMRTLVRGDGVIVMVDDITERHRRETVLHHRATTDPVTGLPNRTALRARFAATVAADKAGPVSPPPTANTPASTARKSGPAALFLDLDAFRRVNHSFGYSTGDATLLAAAQRFSSVLGPSDILGRWDGDEFVVLTDSGAAADVAGLAERLTAALDEPLDVQGHQIRLSVSIGVALAQAAPATSSQDPLAGRRKAAAVATGSAADGVSADCDALITRAGHEVTRARSQRRAGQPRRPRPDQ